jgi:hypothetical protein
MTIKIDLLQDLALGRLSAIDLLRSHCNNFFFL